MRTYIRSIRENFNQCLFIGFVLWALCINPLVQVFSIESTAMLYVILPLLNGFLSFLTIYGWRLFLKRFIKSRYKYISFDFSWEIIAFFAGFICIFASFKTGALLLGGIIALLTILKIESFIRRITAFLPPNHYITHRELFLFLGFFIDLIIFFTILNLTLGIVDYAAIDVNEYPSDKRISSLHSDNLFNALYFTVITLTTVGYGDFIPVSYFGKMIVILECLTAYVMFGLMIGLMTRGIRPPKSINKTPHQKSLARRK